MAKMKWDQIGEHFYENGVSDVALFVFDSTDKKYGAGVPWNGVTNVTISPEGAEPTNLFANNRKYLSLLSAENVNGSIEAYTYPDEFNECLGMYKMAPGMRVAQQAHKTFALCFKSGVGSDTNPNAGFKFHILYGCVASPSERAYNTINEDLDVSPLSFEISTTPVEAGVEGYNAFSYIELDSRDFGTDLTKLNAVLDKFYGTDGAEGGEGTEPELLLPKAVYDLLKAE